MAYFITGKLGAGKSLVAVAKIREALHKNRRVATNLDIYTDKIVSKNNKSNIIRLPDKPRPEDLHNMGRGTDSVEEDDFGVLVLDECATWLNSRTWNDPERKKFIDWMLHARKLGWTVYFIIQNIELVDKQAKLALCEYLVICRRLDRLNIPVIAPIMGFVFGWKPKLPKIHMAKVYYGENETSLVADRWTYQAKDLYSSYDTNQVFVDDLVLSKSNKEIDMRASYSVLSAYLLKGRYVEKSSFQFKFIYLLLAPTWLLVTSLKFIIKPMIRVQPVL